MTQFQTIQSQNGTLCAKVNLENGQLVSFTAAGHELLHGGGLPPQLRTQTDETGWMNTEIIMYPLIGPAEQFRLRSGNTISPMDQHGIARLLTFNVKEKTPHTIILEANYHANDQLVNPKAKPDNHNPKYVSWPHNVRITKTFNMDDVQLQATFYIEDNGNDQTPRAFGWHPAFRVPHTALYEIDGIKDISHAAVVKAGNNAFSLPGAKKITCKFTDKNYIPFSVQFNTGNAMLWSPAGSSLVCIEPITDFQGQPIIPRAKDKQHYTVTITPHLD